MIDRRLLAVALAAAVAAAALTAYVVRFPINPTDVADERAVQSIQWGPLDLTFRFFSFIGDAKGTVIVAFILVLVLVFNRRAWPFALAAALSAGWYQLLSRLIIRPRPTTAQVLLVTEHPGASSYPSGHTIFIVTVVTVLMFCFGYRFLRGWARAAGWVVGGVIVLLNGLGRIDSGAHWPTDVLAGLLIATAWIAFILSVRTISSRVLDERARD